MIDADIKTKVLTMVPVAFAIMLLVVAGNIKFEDGLSKTEYQVLDFEYRDLSIPKKEAVVPSDIFKAPLDSGRKGAKYEISEGSDIGISRADLNVSLVIVSGNSKMAIIQGVLVKEGDIIDDKKVLKIEPGRVLLKNKINQWVNVTK